MNIQQCDKKMKSNNNISMGSETGSSSIHSLLQSDRENLLCFDCGHINIKYLSLNLGITLCSDCASVHNLLIPEISSIKSLSQPFSNQELKLVSMGGNGSLKVFFAMYSIPCNDSIEYKYRTVACKYYMEMLRSMALEESCPMLTPSESEGIELAVDPGKIMMNTMDSEGFEMDKEPIQRKINTMGSEELQDSEGLLARFRNSKVFKSVEDFTTDTFSAGISYFQKKISKKSNTTEEFQ